MGIYFEGKTEPFQTIDQRRALIGKHIKYLTRACIDRSGRGYFFPRYDIVVAAKNREIVFENGDSASRGDLVEIQILDKETE